MDHAKLDAALAFAESLTKRADAGKDSHAEARYTPNGTDAEHCGNCTHYAPPHCSEVQDPIVKGGWCKHWHS